LKPGLNLLLPFLELKPGVKDCDNPVQG